VTASAAITLEIIWPSAAVQSDTLTIAGSILLVDVASQALRVQSRMSLGSYRFHRMMTLAALRRLRARFRCDDRRLMDYAAARRDLVADLLAIREARQ